MEGGRHARATLLATVAGTCQLQVWVELEGARCVAALHPSPLELRPSALLSNAVIVTDHMVSNLLCIWKSV